MTNTKKSTTNKKARRKTKKNYSDGFLKFMDAIEGHSKDVSIILRCHLLAEYFLDQIILSTLLRGDLIVTDGHLTFTNKLLLVKSLDIINDDVLTSIKHLNTVRNNCSHQMNYNVSEADIDLIGRPFGKEYSKSKQKIKELNSLLEDTLMRTFACLEGDYDKLIKSKK